MSSPSPAISRVLQALLARDAAALIAAIRECRTIDERLPDGESALFHAILSGRVALVEAMLTGGADPNFRATGLAENSLAPTPLDLAEQARFLMDWDTYHPIALLLQSHGAHDWEGRNNDPEQIQAVEAHARSWQMKGA